MSHENPQFDYFERQGIGAGALRQENQSPTDDPYHLIDPADTAHDLLSVAQQEQHPRWAIEADNDTPFAFAAPFSAIQRQMDEGYSRFGKSQKATLVETRSDDESPTLSLNLRNMRDYRAMRPTEARIPFESTPLADTVATEQHLGTFETYNRQLEREIAAMVFTPFAEMNPPLTSEPLPTTRVTRTPSVVPLQKAFRAPGAASAQPVAELVVTSAVPVEAPPAAMPVEPVAETPAKTTQQIALPVESRIAVEPSAAEYTAEKPVTEAVALTKQEPAAQPTETYQLEYEQTADVAHLGTTAVEKFLSRNKRTARIVEIAGAVSLAATAGAKLLGRLRRRP